jgi:hypothetical protein
VIPVRQVDSPVPVACSQLAERPELAVCKQGLLAEPEPDPELDSLVVGSLGLYKSGVQPGPKKIRVRC